MHTRKVFSPNGVTLVVSIPKEIAKEFGLKEGTSLHIESKMLHGRAKILMSPENEHEEEIKENLNEGYV